MGYGGGDESIELLIGDAELTEGGPGSESVIKFREPGHLGSCLAIRATDIHLELW